MTDEDASRAAAAANYTDIQHHDTDGDVAGRLASWLTARTGSTTPVTITNLHLNDANGMSSDTVLFDATWTPPDDGTTRSGRYVLRRAPDMAATPVFPTYDLTGQVATMTAVARHSSVPVPRVAWDEPDPAVLGRPFFVMERVDGLVPPDVLPYTFGDSWVTEGDATNLVRMQSSMVDLLAELHAIDDPTGRFAHLELDTPGDTHLARQLADVTAWYQWSCGDSSRSTLIESALEQLTATLPDDPGETVVSWGDARIGNVLFVDHAPVGVLDWENAVLGPRELDVVWLTYSHRVFQELTVDLGAAGLPGFLRFEDVTEAYSERTGHELVHLRWHLLFAATRWAIVFLRTGAREAAVSGHDLPEDGDTLLYNRPSLEDLLA